MSLPDHPARPVPTRSLRIAVFINGLPRGGAETQLLRVVRALRGAGHEIRLFVLLPENDFTDELGDLQVELLSVRPGPGSVIGAIRQLRSWRPTVVLSFLYQATVVARVAAAAARVPIVIGSMRNEKLESRPRTTLYRLTGLVDTVTVTNSERAGASLVASRTISARKLRIIPNGLDAPPVDDSARRRLRAEWGVGDETVVFLGVGRLTPQKDWANLVAAAQRYEGPAALWLVAGLGDLEDELRAQIAASRLTDDVRLLGLRSDVPDLLAACDALVLASHYEGMPNVVLEAMAAGKPAVTTRVGACADLLAEGSAQPGGLLVEARDPQALARAMAELAALPVAQRAAMGARNAAHVREQYSLTAADRRWVELVAELDAAGQR